MSVCIIIQLIMSSPADDSLEAFLINECHLQRDCAAFPFLKKMGFKSKQQLVAFLPKLSVKELTKLGLPEEEATAIMGHCNKTSPKRTTSRMFPRLASKYLTLQIVGYAFVQEEAVDLEYLCQGYRQLLIRNYQLFKKAVIKSEKKVIRDVLELLDERWLSKRYRLTYYSYDNEKDVADCLALLGDRLHFHSITIPHSFYLLNLFSQFRPIKIKIDKFQDIPQLFKLLPHSVTELTLLSSDHSTFVGDYGGIRKFRKLKLLYCEQTLEILSKYATATESLTIDAISLEQPGVMVYIAKVDCKQIIVRTSILFEKKLQKFFN
ncbi:hypothetical protein FGO68_gene8411 [Halteria grandinella]|uniref:Uncharacterized protein n=1 Tax=Halteria grandinella TaxID=5974 RepID=A0A8J8NY22_HALGN|nr:hypothetical protein FGO68_gene8411 [Halteria grandinella]